MTRWPSQQGTRPPVSIGFVALYVLAQFGIWVALLTPVVLTLALRVGDIASEAEKSRWLGIILAIGGFVALVATPICGALSDRTRSRFGRRRPWLVGGLVVADSGLLAAILPKPEDSATAPIILTIGSAQGGGDYAILYIVGCGFALLGAVSICPVRRSR